MIGPAQRPEVHTVLKNFAIRTAAGVASQGCLTRIPEGAAKTHRSVPSRKSSYDGD